MSEEIQKTIDYLTQKFGSTGAELWQAIVSQVQFDGWTGIGHSLLLIICWTADGGASGGTGQAMKIARHYNIPVFNLQLERDRERISQYLA